MDSASPNLTNFFLKGHVTGFFRDVSYLREFNFVHCEHPSLGQEEHISDPRCRDMLRDIQAEIVDRFISKIFHNYELVSYGMWEGVDKDSQVWHNDQFQKRMNSNFLIYLDDTFNYDNSIEFKNHSEHYKVLPRENDFVWINQSKHFFHRASHNSGRRRVLSFEFFIDGLD
jgi:hypothetical protein